MSARSNIHTDPNYPCFSFGLDYEWVGVQWMDQVFLQHLFRLNRYRQAVEFGTYNGVTSCFVASMLRFTGGNLVTIDRNDGRQSPVRQYWPENAVFLCADLLAAPPHPGVINLIQNLGPSSLLIVDNGNKPEEVRRYVPHLPVGAQFVVHDWGEQPGVGEITPDDVSHLLDRFVPIEHDVAKTFGSSFRCWERRA